MECERTIHYNPPEAFFQEENMHWKKLHPLQPARSFFLRTEFVLEKMAFIPRTNYLTEYLFLSMKIICLIQENNFHKKKYFIKKMKKEKRNLGE